MEQKNAQIKALIKLHQGLKRQGPGDEAFSRHILSLLPKLPEDPRIADFGCGSGAGTLLLAKWFNSKIAAVDFSRPFLDELEDQARKQKLDHLVQLVEGDIGNLDWPEASVDLLWSEGAAYILTFAGALKSWRPLMTRGGIVVISELVFFTNDIPKPVLDFWQIAYPTIASETENSKIASENGFKVSGVHRLPEEAWWNNYYNPLQKNIKAFRTSADVIMQEVIENTETEIELFRDFGDIYGYSFFILKAV